METFERKVLNALRYRRPTCDINRQNVVTFPSLPRSFQSFPSFPIASLAVAPISSYFPVPLLSSPSFACARCFFTNRASIPTLYHVARILRRIILLASFPFCFEKRLILSKKKKNDISFSFFFFVRNALHLRIIIVVNHER